MRIILGQASGGSDRSTSPMKSSGGLVGGTKGSIQGGQWWQCTSRDRLSLFYYLSSYVDWYFR